MIPQAEPWLTNAESEAVARVIASNRLSEGTESQALAVCLNNLIGTPYGVFAPSGTAALTLGLLALGIGPGDAVLVPDITFIGSANAVLMTGATPVFVDVDRATYQIDVRHAGRLVSPRTRAIMPVHLYGAACDMNAVLAFAAQWGLKVIEDAAQGIGVSYLGRHVGSLGDVGCFSFFGDKTITMGEGGYVVCRDAAIYERLLRLRNQGRPARGGFIHEMVGYNFRITDLQAAVGLAQLGRLAEIVARKTALYAEYCRRLAGLPGMRILGAGCASSFVPFRCVLIVDHVDGLLAHLQQAGVETRTFFYPMHRQPCFTGADSRVQGSMPGDAEFPNSMHGFRHGACLPLFPTLEISQVAYITDRIIEFYCRVDHPGAKLKPEPVIQG